MIEIKTHSGLCGSAFDGVAQGVARGLGRLFPPIHLPVAVAGPEEQAEAGETLPAPTDQAAA